MEAQTATGLPEWATEENEWILPFPSAELERRRDGVLAKMAEEGIDVAVFSSQKSLIYLTANEAGGPQNFNRLVLAQSGDHRYVLRLIDAGWERVWAPQTWLKNWMPYRDGEAIDAATVRAMREVSGGSVRRLAMELDRPSISYDSIKAVATGSGAEDLVSSTHLVEDLRVIKSDVELELMRRAGVISTNATNALVQSIRNGATDVEAAIAAQTIIMREGGSHTHNQPYVFAGPAGEMGHMDWVRVAPEPGETVSWYLSGVTHYYANPIERTLLRLPDKSGVVDMIEAVATATQRLVDGIRPSMTSEEAYQLAYNVHVDKGYDKYFVNNAAYSTGIKWDEFDLFRIRPNDQRVIKAGMTFHVVPMLIVPGIGNICASRVIAITEDGGELLNAYPLRLEPF